MVKRHPEYDHLAATCKSMEVEVEIEKIQVDMEADGKFYSFGKVTHGSFNANVAHFSHCNLIKLKSKSRG